MRRASVILLWFAVAVAICQVPLGFVRCKQGERSAVARRWTLPQVTSMDRVNCQPTLGRFSVEVSTNPGDSAGCLVGIAGRIAKQSSTLLIVLNSIQSNLNLLISS